MKSKVIFFFLCASILGCHDAKETRIKETPITLNRNAGQQIPLSVAQRWMGRKNNSAGREASPFQISATTFNETVYPLSERTGIVFRHALDGNGTHHILIIPLNKNIAPEDATLFVDANTDSQIDSTIAHTWIANYEASHPNEVWYHFFGGGIFEEVQAHPLFNKIVIEPALNDDDQPQLLLFVWNNAGTANGRTNQDDEVVVYDFSNPCPPCSNNN